MTKKRSIRCPKCRSIDTKRRGKRFVVATKKWLLRVTCHTCLFTGTVGSSASLRSKDDLNQRLARESLERASLRILSRRYEKARNTIMHIIRRVCEGLPDSTAIAKRFCPI